jgi:anthranilate/para-aminobenzoate synthase component I
VTKDGGTLPDRSETDRPLVEFVIPGETLTFTSRNVTHRGLGGIDVSRFLAPTIKLVPPNPSATPLDPVSASCEQAYIDAVRRGISAVSAGEAKKLVLSRYQAYDADFDPVALFGALQPPFVDAFLVCYGDLVAVVPSPELLLSGSAGWAWGSLVDYRPKMARKFGTEVGTGVIDRSRRTRSRERDRGAA